MTLMNQRIFNNPILFKCDHWSFVSLFLVRQKNFSLFHTELTENQTRTPRKSLVQLYKATNTRIIYIVWSSEVEKFSREGRKDFR